ncbi:plasmid mobilization relaxosome protein MobC [Helicobacter baculiformis]|uniref:OMP475 n=1 Tax=Helicobacter baculiformis TaxID=427351 RepID=A0A1M4NHH3_9HELI|nr:plasmid mobilization relaxosome protein MobC [Helicobacter baculiformis]SFZ71390.1 OMP475 [Helicobacter baculiformis]
MRLKNPNAHRKSKLKSGGKRMVFILDAKSAAALKELSHKHKISMTKIIETMILEQKPFCQQNKWLLKTIALMQEHKNLYTSLNTTFSNLNQIARHLNIYALTGETINDALLAQTQAQVQHCAKQLELLKLLVLKNIILLSHKNKIQKKKQ